MTASNIDVSDFIKVLSVLRSKGITLIDLDMVQDEHHPSMNKLVIHPVSTQQGFQPMPKYNQDEIEIRDPKIDPTNNDIFSSFDL